MARLISFNPLTTSLHSSSSCFPSTLLSPSSTNQMNSVVLPSRYDNGIGIHMPRVLNKRGSVIVKAASEIGKTGSTESNGPEPPSESKKEVVPVDKLPLESKLQERQEQKMRMKLAKKIRLRRKRLVRKRRLRKKGRWPPSKMKKLKNV